MNSKENYKIICPHCGAEYLPAEILYPESVLGNPIEIIKDEKGNIVHFEGESVNLEEEYTCDFCNHTFLVKGELGFVVKEKIDDFDEDWTTTVFENRIPLEEDK